jgi:hypothetical protein
VSATINPPDETQLDMLARRTAWLIKPGARVLCVSDAADRRLLDRLRLQGCQVTQQPKGASGSGDLGSSSRFDVAIVSDSFVSDPNPKIDIAAAASLLVPEGYLIASVPNLAFGEARLQFLAGQIPDGWEDGKSPRRFHTMDTVADVFEECGFVVGHFERVEVPVEAPMNSAPSGLPFTDIVAFLSADKEAATSHYIAMAFRLPAPGIEAFRERVRALIRSCDAAREEASRATRAALQLEQDLSACRRQLDDRDALMASLRTNIDELRDSEHALRTAKGRESTIHEIQIAALESEIQAFKKDAQSRIRAIERSLSWRVTAPLRVLGRYLGLGRS